MKKTTRRVYMSILLVVLSLFTAVATTFAWVGISSNTTFQKFTINLKENEEDNNSEYGIRISLSGKEGTFYEEIPQEDIQKQILNNMGYDDSYISRIGLSKLFSMINLDQCTVARNDSENPSTDTVLTDFYDMNGISLIKDREMWFNYITKATGFIYFDLYLMVYSVSGSDVSLSSPNIFLKGELLSGQECSANVLNRISLPNYFNEQISGKVSINSANASRVAIQRFDIVDKYDLNEYERDSMKHPNKLIIYRTGSQTPKYDLQTGMYDFGAIMPKTDNFAYQYYNSMYGDTFTNLEGRISLDRCINRGDVLFEDGDSSTSPNLILPESMGFSSEKMVKYRVYFWFEGWDGDCMEAINAVPVNLNLKFSTRTHVE